MGQRSQPDNPGNSKPSAPRRRTPFTHFVLVLAISIPLWLTGHLTNLQILPGLITACIAVIAILVWGPKALSQSRNTPESKSVPAT